MNAKKTAPAKKRRGRTETAPVGVTARKAKEKGKKTTTIRRANEPATESIEVDGLRFEITSRAIPEQYEVYAGRREVGYVRIRHGHFRVECSRCGGVTVLEKDFKNEEMGTLDPAEDWITALGVPVNFDSAPRMRKLKQAARAIRRWMEKNAKDYPMHGDGTLPKETFDKICANRSLWIRLGEEADGLELQIAIDKAQAEHLHERLEGKLQLHVYSDAVCIRQVVTQDEEEDTREWLAERKEVRVDWETDTEIGRTANVALGERDHNAEA